LSALKSWPGGLDGPNVDPDETLLKLVVQADGRTDGYAREVQELVDKHGLRDALVGETRVVDPSGRPHEVGECVRGLAHIEAAEGDRCDESRC